MSLTPHFLRNNRVCFLDFIEIISHLLTICLHTYICYSYVFVRFDSSCFKSLFSSASSFMLRPFSLSSSATCLALPYSCTGELTLDLHDACFTTCWSWLVTRWARVVNCLRCTCVVFDFNSVIPEWWINSVVFFGWTLILVGSFLLAIE